MRRLFMVAALVSLMVMVFAGVALARNFQCTERNCYGTTNNDTIFERGGDGVNDNIYGDRGADRLFADNFGNDRDRLFGQGGNDTLDARDGDPLDTLDGGGGTDACFGDVDVDSGVEDDPETTEVDESLASDTFVNCETINGEPAPAPAPASAD